VGVDVGVRVTLGVIVGEGERVLVGVAVVVSVIDAVRLGVNVAVNVAVGGLSTSRRF
jgi:hypothetical protein